VEIDSGETKIIPPTALAIMDDWSHSITFNSQSMETERLVIIEEQRRKMGPRERIGREWHLVFFRGSRFA